MPKKIIAIIVAAAVYRIITIVIMGSFIFRLVSGEYTYKPFSFLNRDTSSYSTSYKNVKIVTYPEHDMFPDSWWKTPNNGKVSPLAEKNRVRALDIIEHELDKYSTGVLDQNLKKIYLFDDLEFFGYKYGGTYYNNNVFLVVRSVYLGYSDDVVKRNFHHEFSSIFLKNYSRDFDEDKWTSFNAPGFKYGSGGTEALKNGNTGRDFEDRYNKLGVLNEYSAASVEEDFNEISGNLFLSTRKFWDAVDKYNGLKKKVSFAIEFYNKIDTTYSEKYFRGIEEK